jgi:uncharacterized membrane protein
LVPLVIFSRWIHIVTACLALGGVFFMRFIFPAGISVLPDDQRSAVFLNTRRKFKIVIHTAILLFLITGTFNTMIAWEKYERNPALMHPLWGTHVLLALVAFTIAIIVLAGPTPIQSHRKLMAINFVILLLTVAVASTLKWARESSTGQSSPIPSQTGGNP